MIKITLFDNGFLNRPTSTKHMYGTWMDAKKEHLCPRLAIIPFMSKMHWSWDKLNNVIAPVSIMTSTPI